MRRLCKGERVMMVFRSKKELLKKMMAGNVVPLNILTFTGDTPGKKDGKIRRYQHAYVGKQRTGVY